MNYLLVMIGGALGALCRYGVGQLLACVRVASLPVGTLTVNLLGCIILGLLTGMAERNLPFPALTPEHSRQLLLLLTVGFCGAFTTFSTFSGETVKALEAGLLWETVGYVMVSVGVGVLLFWFSRNLVA